MKIAPKESTGPIKHSYGKRHGQSTHPPSAHQGNCKTHINQRVDTSVLDHLPSVLCRRNVRLSVQRDVAVGVSVKELDCPVQKTDDAAQDAEEDVSEDASNPTLLSGLGAGHRAQLSQELDDGDQQAAEADRAEAISEGSPGRTSSGTLREVVRVEVPRAIDARDGDVDGVLDPLRDPVHGKGNEYHESDDLPMAAPAARFAASRVVGRWLVLGVDTDKRDRVPRSKARGDHATDEAHQVGVSVLLAHIHARLEHQRREGDARYPRPEGEDEEDGEDGEHYSRTPVLPPVVEHGRADGPADIEDARDPDELLREESREPDIRKGEDDGDDEDKHEEHNGVGVEREGVAPIVDATAVDISSSRVRSEGDARDGYKTEEDEEELEENISASCGISRRSVAYATVSCQDSLPRQCTCW